MKLRCLKLQKEFNRLDIYVYGIESKLIKWWVLKLIRLTPELKGKELRFHEQVYLSSKTWEKLKPEIEELGGSLIKLEGLMFDPLEIDTKIEFKIKGIVWLDLTTIYVPTTGLVYYRINNEVDEAEHRFKIGK